MVTDTTTKKGSKQTKWGVIPEDWSIEKLPTVCWFQEGPGLRNWQFTNSGIKVINVTNLENGYLNLERTSRYISLEEFERMYQHFEVDDKDIVVASSGNSYAKVAVVRKQDLPLVMNTSVIRFKPLKNLDYSFLLTFLKSNYFKDQIDLLITGGAQPNFGPAHLKQINIITPSNKSEQTAIATILSDTDALIECLEELIVKKKAIKKGAMQQLLTGKKRLPGFNGEWEIKSLEEIIVCLDNLRVPLNDEQRSKIKGDYPYCGANGVLDYVNDYVIDDDIILIAEDGGYFDEYAYRPIAYRMYGKSWVNNHAHILKAKDHIDQNFIYYSLVHKNILSFLASGTRAKLNKSEMYKIEINIPKEKSEQTAITTVLSDVDIEIESLEQKRGKYTMLKQGMMQQLLTGKIRIYGNN